MASEAPVELQFTRSSTPGERPGEGEGRLINAFLEKLGDKFLFRRTAGLGTFGATSGLSSPRGTFEMGGFIYAVYGVLLVAWTTGGGGPTTLTGALAGSGRVTFARNLAATPDLVAVNEGGGAYVISSAGTVSSYPDFDLPGSANSVAALSAYFIFGDSTTGQIWASQVNSTDVEALSFASAEAASDKLIRVMRSGNAILAFGENTIEPWLDMGTSPFPLRRHTTVIEVGLKEFGAVAGSQIGWDRGIIFVAHDGTVVALDGYNPKRISTPDVERFIADSTPGSLDAQVYTDRGQSVWSLTSNVGTWHYYVDQGSWAERQTGGLLWRATSTVKAAGVWYAQDKLSGSLLYIRNDVLTDVGAPLTFMAQSAPLKQFPLRTTIPAAHLDFTRGNGGTMEFSYSLDGGRNFSDWESFSLGGGGEDDGPIIVNRLGRASTHGLIVRVRVTDAIGFAFMGASVPAGVRAS